MSTEKRTIGETAQLLGVSIRTLHYWEERGITHPSRESWSGYRLYSEADITRLQQALVYRATGMDLDTIVELLNSNDDPVAHFQRQRDKLIDKEHELRAMIEALDHLLEDAMTDKKLSIDDIADVLGDANFATYHAEAEEKWGDTDDWAIAQRTSAKMSADDWKSLKKRTDAIENRLATAMKQGVLPGSPEANELADAHRELLSKSFPVSYAKQVILARGYVEDLRFTRHYDSREEGLAQWLKAIIDANARAHGVDPNSATWE